MRKVANLKYMTNSLQELIDASIFISTEYQARVAELVGAAQWDVDFTAQSLSFETTPPVSLRPYLLGTESENRGTWVWSWQQLGYFPDAVVSAAVQAREAGEKKSLTELSTDEIPLSDSLARHLTLASKTVTGLYAHYPLPAGAGVRAWTLLDGDELVLPEPTMKRVGRVIAQTLQGENIVNQVLAVDSYAKQRGFHIAWDTEATAVLTLTDGALRLWFDEGRMSGIEEAKPQVGPEVLAKCLSQAAEHRAALAQARESLEKVAAAEAQQQNAEREQQAAQKAAARAEAERAEQQERAEAERAAERAKVEREQAERAEREKMAAQKAEREAAQKAKAEREKAEREQVKAEREKVTGVSTTEHLYPDTEAPFDQDPREDSEHGTVTTSTLPAGAYRDGEAEDAYEAETVDLQVHEDEVHTGVTEVVEVQEEHTEISIDEELIHAPEEELEHPEQEPEELPEPLEPEHTEPEHAEPEHVEPEEHEPEHTEPVQQEHKTDEEGKKKGFFSRFFGL